jgi:hypothetical protein
MAEDKEQVAADGEFEATLIHGETYFLGNKCFLRGQPLTVTAAEKAQLEDNEHAGDILSLMHGDEVDTHVRMKFSFAPAGSGRDAGAERPRTRRSSGEDEPSPPRRVRQARG